MSPAPAGTVAAVGAAALELGRRQQGRIAFVGATVRSLPHYNRALLLYSARVAVQQLRFTALHALPLVGFVALVIGGTAILQAYSQAVRLGSDIPARLLATVVVRELGPLLTAVIVLGRSGTAVATELAGYRVMGETDALEALGVNPIQLFAIPRIVAFAVAGMVLVVVFDVVAVGSGLLAAAAWSHAPASTSLATLRSTLTPVDVLLTLAKSAVFGAGIAALCSFEGIFGDRTVTDLPRAVSRAVVSSLVLIFLLSAAITAVVYL